MVNEGIESLECKNESAVVSVTLGVDGRLYCHDLTPELARVLAALCPNDPELAARAGLGAVSLSRQGHEHWRTSRQWHPAPCPDDPELAARVGSGAKNLSQ